jgi:hypothetical protein
MYVWKVRHPDILAAVDGFGLPHSDSGEYSII